ncbi:hypothetical protein EXIGLDRAFT_731951 [Exidia glandulosa HHB12029]|uniref:Uncharacterized protein n=1 Tax=Exidia glandulosa HHB12029 TaxID=1314781 RepID=A0A165BPT1_EXIGL|nr:hypothetical protein EXIGLDRAFT_731951 [Exidia glandulosa HHB12029]
MFHQPVALDEDAHRPARGRRHFAHCLAGASSALKVSYAPYGHCLISFLPRGHVKLARPRWRIIASSCRNLNRRIGKRATERAKSFLKGWSVEDKVSLATAMGWSNGPFVGNTVVYALLFFSALHTRSTYLPLLSTHFEAVRPAVWSALPSFLVLFVAHHTPSHYSCPYVSQARSAGAISCPLSLLSLAPSRALAQVHLVPS